MRKRKKHDSPHTSVQSGNAAMTWEEIGIALGYKRRAAKRNAYMIFKRAMEKIRERPEACARLAELVEYQKSQRKELVWPDWSGEA
jgi:hypothetical protein